ncbi:MAG: cobalamin biosynthesis protein CbiD [Lachnospiraceae bacterium]|nr:cobalamin biosynthesis protein CbiD [Lachnospiraceae bacterium]
MRYGFTTGSCAAAASKAAAYMLLLGMKKKNITIETPKGIPYQAEIVDIKRTENEVSCAVVKDGGDDPDVTSGCLVYATVSIIKDEEIAGITSAQLIDETLSNLNSSSNTNKNNSNCICIDEVYINIDGGEGVGRVTKPGLDQPVGSAAINHIPRQMIEEEIRDVCKQADYRGGISVIISVPDGEEIAKKTFNERLGIVGGISIIGTSGIVEPMSSQALLDTIHVELNQRKVQGFDYVAVSPGNYGLDYMLKTYGYDLDRSVKCSNYIGDTIDMVNELGFSGMLLTGHIGKLIKVSGGIMNTHSKEGDCRMELMAAAGIEAKVSQSTLKEVLKCVSTEEAIRLIKEEGKLAEVMQYILKKVMYYLCKRAGERLNIECIIYSNEFGELAKSEGADRWLNLLVQEQEQ